MPRRLGKTNSTYVLFAIHFGVNFEMVVRLPEWPAPWKLHFWGLKKFNWGKTLVQRLWICIRIWYKILLQTDYFIQMIIGFTDSKIVKLSNADKIRKTYRISKDQEQIVTLRYRRRTYPSAFTWKPYVSWQNFKNFFKILTWRVSCVRCIKF